jgi:CheY-like chemotaxis protein
MLIDDDKDELSIFLEALKKIEVEDGFKCTYASSAIQALEMLKYLIPDFIFVDLNMPRMNGLELLSAIRNEKRLQAVRKILYSTSIDYACKEEAILFGATCIEKTSTIEKLSHHLEAVFSLHLASA